MTKDLSMLLRTARPRTVKGEFVFCCISRPKLRRLKIEPLLVFTEKEGKTIIVEKTVADARALKYSGVWSLITMGVRSDLSAIGFLAAITNKLAKARIPVNAISAYHHDHIFVPFEMKEKALRLLRNLSK